MVHENKAAEKIYNCIKSAMTLEQAYKIHNMIESMKRLYKSALANTWAGILNEELISKELDIITTYENA